MQISVKSNAARFARTIDKFGKDQFPFAMAQTLNDIAFEVRNDTIKRVWPKSVTVRKSNFMSAVLMPIRGDNRATKTRLRSFVQNHPTGNRRKDYLQRLAKGGIKRPIDGRKHYNPCNQFKPKKRARRSPQIKKSDRPSKPQRRVQEQAVERTGVHRSPRRQGALSHPDALSFGADRDDQEAV